MDARALRGREKVWELVAAATKSLQSCLTLCDPRDGSPPILGILQARTLEWVAISFSNAWKWKVKVKSLSRVWLLATPWTAAYQALPSMGFSRQEYWSGVPWELVASAKINAGKFLSLINLSTHLFFLLMGIAAAAAKSLQSCLTLCDPIDCSPPGSTVPGILQARTLEWVAISFSNAWKWKMKVKVKSLSHVQLFATP